MNFCSVLRECFGGSKPQLERILSQLLPDATQYDQFKWLQGDGTFSLSVVAAARYQQELAAIYQDQAADDEDPIVLALLIPGDTNPYIPYAVRVQIRNRTVGSLSRRNARALRARLVRHAIRCQRLRCRAKVSHAWEYTGGDGQWHVQLDVCL